MQLAEYKKVYMWRSIWIMDPHLDNWYTPVMRHSEPVLKLTIYKFLFIQIIAEESKRWHRWMFSPVSYLKQNQSEVLLLCTLPLLKEMKEVAVQCKSKISPEKPCHQRWAKPFSFKYEKETCLSVGNVKFLARSRPLQKS